MENQDKRKKWLINLVLVVTTLAFSVPMVLAFVSGLNQPQPAASPSASPTNSADVSGAENAAEAQKLALQAKGYEELLKKEPNNVTAWRGLLETRLAMRDVKGAIAPLEKLVQLNPGESQYAVMLAQAQQELGNPDAAVQVYQQLLNKNPGDIAALNGLAELLVKQQKAGQAVELVQDVIKRAPQMQGVDVTAVKLLLGKVYVQDNRPEEAIAIYDETAKANPKDWKPVFAKAEVLKRQNKADEAQKLYVEAEKLAPLDLQPQIKTAAADPAPKPSESANPGPNGSPSPNASPNPNGSPKPAQSPATP
jgi:tetratricopeptide (TPR) repeat protein